MEDHRRLIRGFRDAQMRHRRGLLEHPDAEWPAQRMGRAILHHLRRGHGGDDGAGRQIAGPVQNSPRFRRRADGAGVLPYAGEPCHRYHQSDGLRRRVRDQQRLLNDPVRLCLAPVLWPRLIPGLFRGHPLLLLLDVGVADDDPGMLLTSWMTWQREKNQVGAVDCLLTCFERLFACLLQLTS